jgi:hypothetical protein
MAEIDVTVHSEAGPDTVFALLEDATTWPVWSPIGSYEPDGTTRVFRTGRTVSREEIVELVAGKRFSYRLLCGLPLKDYRADVDLTPRDGGTDIRWHSTFTGKIPGTAWFYRLVLGQFIRRCAEGLAQHAASR